MENKNKMISKDPKVRKTVVRNFEVKITKPNKHNVQRIASNPNLNDKSSKQDALNKYAVPEINSSKKIIKQIEAIENADPEDFLLPNENDLIEINKKVGQKLNFHIDEKVYKNLVALNINNAEAASKQRSKISSSRRNVIPTSRDIEPNLDDFYECDKETDKPIMVSAVKVKLSPILNYNRRDLYDKFKLLKG